MIKASLSAMMERNDRGREKVSRERRGKGIRSIKSGQGIEKEGNLLLGPLHIRWSGYLNHFRYRPFYPGFLFLHKQAQTLVSWWLHWVTLTMVSCDLIRLVSSLTPWSFTHECSHLRRIARKRLRRHPRRRKEEEVERRRRRSGPRGRFGTSWITWSSSTRLRMTSCWRKFPATNWSHQLSSRNVSRSVDHWQEEHWKNSIGKDSLS